MPEPLGSEKYESWIITAMLVLCLAFPVVAQDLVPPHARLEQARLRILGLEDALFRMKTARGCEPGLPVAEVLEGGRERIAELEQQLHEQAGAARRAEQVLREELNRERQLRKDVAAELEEVRARLVELESATRVPAMPDASPAATGAEVSVIRPAQDVGSDGAPAVTEQVSETIPAPAVSVVESDAGDLIYEVREGERLTVISERFYGNRNRWHRIWQANKDVLPDPNVLRAGVRLRIPPAK